MQIWHFLNSDHGGVARFVEQLVQAQVGQNALKIRVAGSPALVLPVTVQRDSYIPYRAVWGVNQWRFAFQAWQLLRREKFPALIHAHSFLLTKPDIYTVHGLYTEYNQNLPPQQNSAIKRAQFQLLTRLERRILKQARRVVFASQRSRDYVEGEMNIRRPDHFRVILPGVDASRYTPRLRSDLCPNRQKIFPELDPQSRWLLFVGNDFLGKGLLRILECLAGRDGRWVLLAFGKDRVNLEIAQSLGQARPGQVFILSDDSRLLAAYGLSDLLVMDSVSEGFGLVLLEAMAAGCVPVVTRFGGATTIIADGVNGLILDSASAIVEAALSAGSEQLHHLSEQAVKSARLHTWHHVAEAYQDLYSELM